MGIAEQLPLEMTVTFRNRYGTVIGEETVKIGNQCSASYKNTGDPFEVSLARETQKKAGDIYRLVCIAAGDALVEAVSPYREAFRRKSGK